MVRALLPCLDDIAWPIANVPCRYSRRELRTLQLGEVQQVHKGKTTKTFARKRAAAVEPALCLSLVTKSRTIDLQTTSEVRAVLCALALLYVRSGCCVPALLRSFGSDLTSRSLLGAGGAQCLV